MAHARAWWGDHDWFDRVFYPIVAVVMAGLLVFLGKTFIELPASLEHAATRECRVTLATGATATATGCRVATGWAVNGELYCNGITYGPAAWVALECE